MPEKMGHCQVGAHSDISPSYSSSWLGFSLAIRVCSDRILPMRHIDIVEKAVQPLSESKTGFSYHVTHKLAVVWALLQTIFRLTVQS
jgi:hypothetical protein